MEHESTPVWNDGLALADELIDNWQDTRKFIAPREQEFADDFIDRVAERLEEAEKSVYGAVLQGASAGAEEITVDDFHGINELLQNADDLGATELSAKILARSGQRFLCVRHNGNPVEPKHVLGMTLAFLSTKKEDAAAIGKFGIGLKTCAKFSSDMTVHCRPYHFVARDNNVRRSKPIGKIRGLYDPESSDTLILFKLLPDFDTDLFEKWLESWEESSLIFLRHLSKFEIGFRHRGDKNFRFELTKEVANEFEFKYRGHKYPAKRVIVSSTASSLLWHVFSYRFPLPKDLTRSYKETSPDAKISLAVPNGPAKGRFFAGLPLNLETKFPFSVCADFDPDTPRENLQHKKLNSWLLARLAEVISETTIRLFRTNPREAWFGIPLEDDWDTSDDWMDDHLIAAFDGARERIIRECALYVRKHPFKLSECSYPSKSAKRALGSKELQYLRPDLEPLPSSVKDTSGRWGAVLEDLVPHGLVTAREALVVCDNDEFMGTKSTPWLIRLVSSAISEIEESHQSWNTKQLFAHRIVPLSDGARVQAPSRSPSGPALIKMRCDEKIATKFDLVTPLDMELARGEGSDAKKFLSWLQDNSRVLEKAEPIEIVRALIVALTPKPRLLDDDSLAELRNVFARIDKAKQKEVGRALGKVVFAKTTIYVDGKPTEASAPIGETYLPAAYVKEKGAWSSLADSLEGLPWIDKSYSKALKSVEDPETGKSTLGATSFFQSLGALAFPRLISRKFANYEYWESPSRLSKALQGVDNWTRNKFEGDHSCPDLEAVLGSIANEKSKKTRKQRSLGLFKLLARNWSRYYRKHHKARLSYQYHSWYTRGNLDATWLDHLRSIPWLPNVRNKWKLPTDLVARSDLMLAIYGNVEDRFIELDVLDEQKTAFAEALGIVTRAPASHLLELIKATRDKDESIDLLDLRYAALSSLCPPVEKTKTDFTAIDDIKVRELRQEFGAHEGQAGLIFWEGQWLLPSEVRRGKNIFHGRRPIVGDPISKRNLWSTLGIEEPTLQDCIAVLNELPQEESIKPDEALLTDVFRYLAKKTKDTDHKSSKALLEIPLFTKDGWSRERPVFYVGDPLLSNVLSQHVPIWAPPCRIEDLRHLVKKIGVVLLHPADFELAASTGNEMPASQAAEDQYNMAKQNFQNRCLKKSDSLATEFSIGWSNFQDSELQIDPTLTVLAKIRNRRRRTSIPCGVYFDIQTNVLWLADEKYLHEGDIVGRHLAEYFAERREHEFIELAWQVAVLDASKDLVAAETSDRNLFTLAQDSDDDENPLEEIASKARYAKKTISKYSVALGNREREMRKAEGSRKADFQLLPLEALKTVEVALFDGDQVDSKAKTKRTIGLRSSISGGRNLTGYGASAGSPKTGPAPGDLEQRALICLQHVLSQIEKGEIQDTTHLRGIGSDAILDDEKRTEFFEIKSFAGQAPSSVTLTRNEADRARERLKNYWLVVVSGLASEAITVSIYNDPMTTLDWSYPSNVHLTNLNNSKRLNFELRPSRVQ